MLARYMLSVCPSQVSVLLKRLNIAQGPTALEREVMRRFPRMGLKHKVTGQGRRGQ